MTDQDVIDQCIGRVALALFYAGKTKLQLMVMTAEEIAGFCNWSESRVGGIGESMLVAMDSFLRKEAETQLFENQRRMSLIRAALKPAATG